MSHQRQTEDYRSIPAFDETIPPHRISKRARALMIVAGAGAVTVLGAGAGVAVGVAPALKVMVSSPQPDEKFIAASLNRSVVQDGNIKVDCTDKIDKLNGNDLLGQTVKVGPFTLPVARILQSECDLILEYADMADKSNPNWEIVEALDTATHEGQHINTSSTQEAIVQCLSVQSVADFAESLGATSDEALRVQQYDADEYISRIPEYWTKDCYDGGPYDTDLQNTGIFPFPKPK